MGKSINNVPLVAAAQEVENYRIPCSVGDGTAKAIEVRTLMKACADILGITSIAEFDETRQYRPVTNTRSSDCYCLYKGKLYRFTQAHYGPWTGTDALETNLYQELLTFYGQAHEEVKVKVYVADGGFSVQGIEVGMTLADGTVETVLTNEEGIATFRADKGMAYSIKVSDHGGYTHVPERHFTAMVNSREIPMVYNPEGSNDGVESVTVMPFIYGDGGYAFLSGSKITVSVDGVEEQYVFDDAARVWRFKVPHGKQYTISYPAIDSYRRPDSQTFTASLTQNVIVSGMFAYIGSDEVFICYTDEEGAWHEATVGNFDIKNRSTAKFIHINTVKLRNAVSVRSENARCDFYLPLSTSTASKKWRANAIRFTSLASTTDATKAKDDLDGWGNCHLIAAELQQAGETQDSNYVLPYLKTRDIAEGDGINGLASEAYCVSLGQFQELILQYAAYVSACSVAGREPIPVKGGYVWASTQYSDTNMWSMNNGSPYNNAKTYSTTVFPAYAF